MTNRSLMALLMLMVIYSPLAVDIFLPAIPVMAQDFSVTLTQMQWSISVFLLSMGAGQLLGGPLADRYGRRPVAICGVVIYGVSCILSALSNSLEFFLFTRLIQGLGACAIVVSAFACVRDRFNPLQSGVVYSYLNGAIYCVPALAPLLGDLLTELYGWRSNFEFMAAYAVCAGIIIAFVFPETRPDSTVQHEKLISVGKFIPIIKHPVFLFNAIVVMLTMAILIAYVSSSPAWLMVQLGLSRETFVYWFSINAALNIVACFVAPKILLKLGAKTTIGLGMATLLASGVLMLLLLDWHEPAGFMLPVMIASLGTSLLMGSCSGQALAPFGDNAGAASALLGFLQMSGAAVLVSLLQLLPLSEPEQLSVMIFSVLPVYVLWLLPKINTVLYEAMAVPAESLEV